MLILRSRLLQIKKETSQKKRADLRKQQVGSGMRGDKIRTIRVKDNQVFDHQTGKKITYKDYIRGRLKGLK